MGNDYTYTAVQSVLLYNSSSLQGNGNVELHTSDVNHGGVTNLYAEEIIHRPKSGGLPLRTNPDFILCSRLFTSRQGKKQRL